MHEIDKRYFQVCLISAQDENSNWRFGVGIGVNTLKLGKAKKNSNFFGGSESEIDLKGGHRSFQGNATASYDLNRHWRFVGGLGITKAKCLGFRKSVSSGLFEATVTQWDTVSQNYLLVEMPLYLRWQIIAEDGEVQGFKVFADLGLSIKFPLTNKSSFGHSMRTVETPLFGGTIITDSESSGELKVLPLSYYFAIGGLIGEHFTIALSWTSIRTEAANSGTVDYQSTLTSLTLNRFF